MVCFSECARTAWSKDVLICLCNRSKTSGAVLRSSKELSPSLPGSLVVRIPGFHPGAPGSTPGMGSSFRFPSAYAPSHEPHNKPTVCFQLPGLLLIWWSPFKWLKTVALNYVDCVPLQKLFPPFSISFAERILQPRSHQRSRCQYQVTEHTLLPTSPITNLLSVSSC